MPDHWNEPEGGPSCVAIRRRAYEAREQEAENFFGRPLWKYSHTLVHDGETYVVFCFKEKTDADAFMRAFDGEPFDPRDKGSGKNWTRWYKGRAAKRKRNPYDFSP